jgi:glycosyltransferase involved in cell wall biosynthesis
MSKKTNVSNRRYPQPATELPQNPSSLEQIPAPLQQAQARPRPDQVGADRLERIRVSQPPRLSPTLPDIVPVPGDAIANRDTTRRRVIMLGLRGVPNVQGGVEKHVEMLAQELVVRGWDVEVLARPQYLQEKAAPAWRGIRIVPIWAPKSMMLEAFCHSFAGVIYAAIRRPDILHIHAIGPGLLAPLARLMGLKVVVTHHGYDYDREKWSSFAKRILRLGERMAISFASAGIAVSRDIATTMKSRYNRDIKHIPNGVIVRPSLLGKAALNEFGLRRQRYIVMVARFVPEKRQTDLIAAFEKLGNTDWKLVLVGGADHGGTAYAREVEQMAARVPGVVLTGFQSGDNLAALFSQAGLFVLPSIHEGMPIALLEAMSYGLPVIASDIVANHEVDLPPEDYFPPGDVEALASALARKMAEPFEQETALARIREIEKTYAWPSISRDTIAVYRAAIKPRTGKARS